MRRSNKHHHFESDAFKYLFELKVVPLVRWNRLIDVGNVYSIDFDDFAKY